MRLDDSGGKVEFTAEEVCNDKLTAVLSNSVPLPLHLTTQTES